ncbi:hypothetical protein WICPIJ_002605 [Wickerhamomyces pijperi]|uniref:Major facilitator superfamily (MFS) profile domain-containing protein n=1 Tax=Wickerhamomyces pijperi TaxID=599730 RepID=A0A9P8Q9H8_WICPI|nr:hypothetical protein WICPIJ_002605 [Wickerhamomyces pijperi]
MSTDIENNNQEVKENITNVPTGASVSTSTLNEKTGTTAITTAATAVTVDTQAPDVPLTYEKTMAGLKTFCFLAVANSFTGFAFGWDVGTAGGIVNFPSFQARFGSLSEATGTSTINSWVVGCIISMFNLGCAFGGMLLSKVADKIGRKKAIFIGCAIYAVGTLIQITSIVQSSWVQVLVGRIISGLSIGLFSVVTPMLISECSPTCVRGQLVVFFQVFITFGIFMGNITNFACNRYRSGEDSEWMIPIGLNFVWLAVIIAATIFMHESPAYLLAKGEYEKSAEVTRVIHATKDITESESVFVEELIQKRLNEHEATTNNANDDAKIPWNEFIVGKPKLGLRLIIGMCVMMFQQLSGANYFFYYGTTLFRSVGMDNPYKTAIILGAVNFASTFLGTWAVKKFGRKACLLTGSAVMGVSMLVYAILGSFFLVNKETGTSSRAIGGVMIAVTCIYIIGFASTWGPVAFVVVSELFPSRVRVMSMSCSVAMNWISNFLISLLTPTIINAIDFKYGFIFAGCLLASFVVVFWLLKETKDCQTDEDTDNLYAGKTTVADADTESTASDSVASSAEK